MMLPGSKQASLGFSAEGGEISGDSAKSLGGFHRTRAFTDKSMHIYGPKQWLYLLLVY